MIEDRCGLTPPELIGPDCPPEAAYLWGWFGELDAARGSNGFGPLPLSFGDIAAWSQLTGRRLIPWETGLLRRLDRLYLSIWIAGRPKAAR